MGCISYLLDGLTSDLANLAFAGRLLGQLLSSVNTIHGRQFSPVSHL